MRIKLETIITTYIETEASLEEARKEIFPRLFEGCGLEEATTDVETSHSAAICYDVVIKTSTETKLVACDE